MKARSRPGAAGDPDAALLDRFSDGLWLNDGLARNTLAAYRRDMAQLLHNPFLLPGTRIRGFVVDIETFDLEEIFAKEGAPSVVRTPALGIPQVS